MKEQFDSMPCSPHLHSNNHDTAPPPPCLRLPTEVFAVIFGRLTRPALYQCLLVSRLWHDQAEAQLYGVISLHAQRTRLTQLLTPALKTRRHLLRRVQWRSNRREEQTFVTDLLDILLDYSASDSFHSNNSIGNGNGSGSAGRSAFSLASLWLSRPKTPTAITTIPASVIGPQRPGLTHFSFIGGEGSQRLLELVMFNLQPATLTTLELDFENGSGSQICTVDVERILTTFPYLNHLRVVGSMHTFAPAAPTGLQKEGYSTHPGTIDTTPGSDQQQQQHRLESLTVEPTLIARTGPDAFMLFKRLGNLKKLAISTQASYPSWVQRGRPWAFGRALRQHCPKLESIHTRGTVVLWLYDLPILPSKKTPYLTSLIEEAATLSYESESSESIDLSQRWTEDRLRKRLQEQEQGELLAGKTGESFFPGLKTLVLGQDHALSFQDLISLGVQARSLTRLEILFQQTGSSLPWEVYESDAHTSNAAVDKNAFPHSFHPNTIKMIENRRLQRRRAFSNQDLMLFLQVCSSLRYLSLIGCTITYENFIDVPATSSRATTTTAAGAPFIQPWACEKTLETLIIRLDISENHPESHALVWRHLGRFRKLRSLTLTSANMHRGRTTLIPSFAYGVGGLFEGEGRVGETLEEIRTLPNWWKMQDRRETVLWFARMCPKLRVLGLAFNGKFAEGDKGALHTAFLQDKEVMTCSIHCVFVEPNSLPSQVL